MLSIKEMWDQNPCDKNLPDSITLLMMILEEAFTVL